MIKEAEDNAEQDKLVKEKVDARNKLDSYLNSIKSSIGDKG